MKKKYGLFKVLMLLLLVVVVCTYCINGRQGTISYLALGDVFLNYLQSFYYFFDTALFILVVGGFYGVLNQIPAYKKLINGIVSKLEDKGKLFVIVITVVLALISAFTGLNLILLLIVPMIVSIVLLLGYDKLVALSATVGSIIVGLISSVFLTIKDSSNYYQVTYTTIDKMIGLDGNFVNVLPRILLLIVSIGLLVWCIISHIKKTEADDISYDLTRDDNLFVSTNDKKKDSSKVWPLAIVLGLALVLLVLGYMPWNSLFEVDCFDKFHETVTKVTFADWKYGFLVVFALVLVLAIYKIVKKVKAKEYDGKFYANVVLGLVALGIVVIFAGYSFDFIAKTDFGKWTKALTLWNSSIFTTLISATFGALGTWYSIGNYMIAMIIVMVAIIVLQLIYHVKVDEVIDGFVAGAKKLLPAAMLAGLAYCILVCSYNNGFMETIITNLGKSFGDNAIVHALVAIVGSIFSVDFFYTANGIFTPILSSLTDKANLNIYSVMFQSLYGLVQLVGPTSILLIIGLSYLEVPYKTWLKYIWRFVVELLIAILLVLMLVSVL